MKKIVFSLGLGLTLAASAFAAQNNIEQLNQEVVKVLAPYQSDTTTAKLEFNALETNSEHAAKLGLNGLYRKVGSQNTLELKIDNLSYNFGDGLAPTTIFKGSLGLDFTKLMSQASLNRIIPNAAEMVEDLAKSYSGEYGDAVSVKGVVTSTTKDADGNYTALTALLSAKIDVKRLPESEQKYVMATDAALSLTLDLKNGVKIDAYMVSNPEYVGFERNEEGLKEVVELLLARDQAMMERINSDVQRIDYMAASLVEMDNSDN